MANVRRIRQTPSPVRIKKILVPIDFSEHSKYALQYAVRFAELFNAEVLLCYVVEPVIYPADFSMGQVGIPNVEDELRLRGQEELDKLVAKHLKKRAVARKVRTFVLTGRPSGEIVRLAETENVDLIVIAAHGHGAVGHLLFGSTTERVVRKAPCPVLTVRGGVLNDPRVAI